MATGQGKPGGHQSRKRWEEPSPGALEGDQPCGHLDRGPLVSRTRREDVSVALSHMVQGHLLQKPQETDPGCKLQQSQDAFLVTWSHAWHTVGTQCSERLTVFPEMSASVQVGAALSSLAAQASRPHACHLDSGYLPAGSAVRGGSARTLPTPLGPLPGSLSSFCSQTWVMQGVLARSQGASSASRVPDRERQTGPVCWEELRTEQGPAPGAPAGVGQTHGRRPHSLLTTAPRLRLTLRVCLTLGVAGPQRRKEGRPSDRAWARDAGPRTHPKEAHLPLGPEALTTSSKQLPRRPGGRVLQRKGRGKDRLPARVQ